MGVVVLALLSQAVLMGVVLGASQSQAVLMGVVLDASLSQAVLMGVVAGGITVTSNADGSGCRGHHCHKQC